MCVCVGGGGGVAFLKRYIFFLKNFSSVKFTQKVKVPSDSALAVFYQHSAPFIRFICSICFLISVVSPFQLSYVLH